MAMYYQPSVNDLLSTAEQLSRIGIGIAVVILIVILIAVFIKFLKQLLDLQGSYDEREFVKREKELDLRNKHGGK